ARRKAAAPPPPTAPPTVSAPPPDEPAPGHEVTPTITADATPPAVARPTPTAPPATTAPRPAPPPPTPADRGVRALSAPRMRELTRPGAPTPPTGGGPAASGTAP